MSEDKWDEPGICQRCAFYERYRPLSDLVDGGGATDCIDCTRYRDACIRDAAIDGEHFAQQELEQLGCERCGAGGLMSGVKWRSKRELVLCDQCVGNIQIPESRW